jgi:hypothetical protein
MPTITLQYTDAEHAELEVEAKRQGKSLYHFVWSAPLDVARAQAGLTKLQSIKRSSILSTQWPRNSSVDPGADK